MRLAINIDHIATLRNARGGEEPNLVEASRVCEQAGALGIVCHLREDRRHIRDLDVRELRKSIKTKLDLEMAATDEIIGIAIDIVPDFVTLVPERRKELTTEDGLNVTANASHLEKTIKRFHDHKIAVSLFVNPIKEQIEAAHAIGTDMIEIHTGEYSEAGTPAREHELLDQVKRSAALARSLGLEVHAGHGLNYTNARAIAAIPEIDELSIGFAIVARAMFVGLNQAVREMSALVQGPSR